MKQKEKLRLMLELMLANADSKGFLSMHIGEFIKMVRIDERIGKGLKHYYEGTAKQKKKILFKEVTDELIDEIYNKYRTIKPQKTENKEQNQIGWNEIGVLNRFNDVEDMLKEQRDLIIALNKELIEIKNRVFWTSDIIEKVEEYLEL